MYIMEHWNQVRFIYNTNKLLFKIDISAMVSIFIPQRYYCFITGYILQSFPLFKVNLTFEDPSIERDQIKLDFYTEHSEWHLKSAEGVRSSKEYDCCPGVWYSKLQFYSESQSLISIMFLLIHKIKSGIMVWGCLDKNIKPLPLSISVNLNLATHYFISYM